jgi:DNA primase
MDPALSGSNGHGALFAAACAMRVGFALDERTAVQLITDLYNPACKPPWSDRDILHKVESAAKQSKRTPGYLLASSRPYVSMKKTGTAEPLSPASYAAVAAELVRLCPFAEEPDVLAYTDRRILIVEGARARIAGLPRPDSQNAEITKLMKLFDAETLHRAGLLRKNEEGQIDTSRFAWPNHRLVIPWRGVDGSIDVLQRRALDGSEPKYVFPSGHKPILPFGAEALRATDAASSLVYVEGALDVLALRLISFRDSLGLVPLGVPGVDGWRTEWAAYAKGRVAMIAFDADPAGDRKVISISRDLYQAGATSVKRFRPRNAKDWCESLERSVG